MSWHLLFWSAIAIGQYRPSLNWSTVLIIESHLLVGLISLRHKTQHNYICERIRLYIRSTKEIQSAQSMKDSNYNVNEVGAARLATGTRNMRQKSMGKEKINKSSSRNIICNNYFDYYKTKLLQQNIIILSLSYGTSNWSRWYSQFLARCMKYPDGYRLLQSGV